MIFIYIFAIGMIAFAYKIEKFSKDIETNA